MTSVGQWVHRQLGQRGVEQAHMVLGRPGRRIARAQDRGQGLARGVEEGDHGLEAEAVLVVRRRILLVRVGIDQGAVDVDHVEARVHAGRPRAARARRAAKPLVDGLEVRQPSARRHLTEEGLVRARARR